MNSKTSDTLLVRQIIEHNKFYIIQQNVMLHIMNVASLT